MMNMKERLKEQRKKGWKFPAVSFGLGYSVGFVLGLSIRIGTPGDGWPVWAIAVIAFGLGQLSGLLAWWLADSRRKPFQKVTGHEL
jgi:hypothetical protein